jgi:hypothetical protein
VEVVSDAGRVVGLQRPVAAHLIERHPPEEQRIGGLALLPKRRLDARYIVLAAGGVEPALACLVPLAGSRQLALSVLDAEVPDEGDRVALGIADGG